MKIRSNSNGWITFLSYFFLYDMGTFWQTCKMSSNSGKCEVQSGFLNCFFLLFEQQCCFWFVYLFFKNMCLFIWLCKDLSCSTWYLWFSLQHVGSSPPTRDPTPAPCTGSVESEFPQQHFKVNIHFRVHCGGVFYFDISFLNITLHLALTILQYFTLCM